MNVIHEMFAEMDGRERGISPVDGAAGRLRRAAHD